MTPFFFISLVGEDPNDERFEYQWALHDKGVADINWEAGRAKWQPQVDVVVAVVDTGIDHTHPDLKVERELMKL